MKIAIFGDSFGDDHINWKDQNRWLDVGPSWVDYLRQFHQVDNFCLGGSSLYFSKRKLEKIDISSYDKVIFLTTDAQRRWCCWPVDKQENGSSWNFMNTETQLKHNKNLEMTKYLTAIDMFFKYIFNESDVHFHQLMIDDIKRKCPTGSIIDVGYGSVLGKINASEIEYFNGQTYRDIIDEGYCDARKCHLCEENNLILGKQIQHCLENNLDLNIDIEKFVTPPREFEHYFRRVT